MATRWILRVRSTELYASRPPSFEIDRCAANGAGAVSALGSSRIFPVPSSIATRQRLGVPPRLLEKYRCVPSGAQIGFQLNAPSVVTATAWLPLASAVQTSTLRAPPISRRLV